MKLTAIRHLIGAKDIATIQIKDSNYSFVSGFADGAVQVIEHTFVPDPDTIPIIMYKQQHQQNVCQSWR